MTPQYHCNTHTLSRFSVRDTSVLQHTHIVKVLSARHLSIAATHPHCQGSQCATPQYCNTHTLSRFSVRDTSVSLQHTHIVKVLSARHLSIATHTHCQGSQCATPQYHCNTHTLSRFSVRDTSVSLQHTHIVKVLSARHLSIATHTHCQGSQCVTPQYHCNTHTLSRFSVRDTSVLQHTHIVKVLSARHLSIAATHTHCQGSQCATPKYCNTHTLSRFSVRDTSVLQHTHIVKVLSARHLSIAATHPHCQGSQCATPQYCNTHTLSRFSVRDTSVSLQHTHIVKVLSARHLSIATHTHCQGSQCATPQYHCNTHTLSRFSVRDTSVSLQHTHIVKVLSARHLSIATHTHCQGSQCVTPQYHCNTHTLSRFSVRDTSVLQHTHIVKVLSARHLSIAATHTHCQGSQCATPQYRCNTHTLSRFSVRDTSVSLQHTHIVKVLSARHLSIATHTHCQGSQCATPQYRCNTHTLSRFSVRDTSVSLQHTHCQGSQCVTPQYRCNTRTLSRFSVRDTSVSLQHTHIVKVLSARHLSIATHTHCQGSQCATPQYRCNTHTLSRFSVRDTSVSLQHTHIVKVLSARHLSIAATHTLSRFSVRDTSVSLQHTHTHCQGSQCATPQYRCNTHTLSRFSVRDTSVSLQHTHIVKVLSARHLSIATHTHCQGSQCATPQYRCNTHTLSRFSVRDT